MGAVLRRAGGSGVLGLGDVVIPGLFVRFMSKIDDELGPNEIGPSYFTATSIAYALGERFLPSPLFFALSYIISSSFRFVRLRVYRINVFFQFISSHQGFTFSYTPGRNRGGGGD